MTWPAVGPASYRCVTNFILRDRACGAAWAAAQEGWVLSPRTTRRARHASDASGEGA